MNHLLKYIDRINLLNKLIRQGRTGTPQELANRLGISTVRLYQLVESLKLLGAPICYSRQRQTYYYEKEYEVNIQINIRELNSNDQTNINAGETFSFCFFQNFCSL